MRVQILPLRNNYLKWIFEIATQKQLFEMDARDLSARAIYQTFKGVLEMACDGASVMVGEHNSFYSHLKEEVKNVILLKFICHSAHFVAGKACAELPQEIESFMRLVYTYISCSSKRCSQHKEIQTYLL
jgi:hypothetical protein